MSEQTQTQETKGMQVAAFIQLALGLMAAAPQIVELVKHLKETVALMVEAKVITKEQQVALEAWIDGNAALVAAGIRPDWWIVEPDPV